MWRGRRATAVAARGARCGCSAVSVEAVFGGALVESVVVSQLAGVLCFYGAGAFLARRRSRFAFGVGLLALVPQILLTPHVVSDLLFEPVVLAFVPWLCGRWARQRAEQARRFRDLSERLDAERERHTGTAADVERIRIARELHDVIVQDRLSVIVLQAGGARMVVESEPQRAREAMRVVESAGLQALAEVRHLLGIFGPVVICRATSPRSPDREHRRPRHAHTRAAGLEQGAHSRWRTDARLSGSSALRVPDCSREPDEHDQARGCGASEGDVSPRERGQLGLQIADDGHGSTTGEHGRSGHGVIGMRERAGLHRGSVDVGSATDGGYRVRASLPLTGRAPDEAASSPAYLAEHQGRRRRDRPGDARRAGAQRPGLDTVIPGSHRVSAAILVVFLVAPLLVRRRWPGAALVTCAAITGVSQAPWTANVLNGMTGTIFPVILLAFTAGARLERSRGLAAVTIAAALIAGGAIWSIAGPATGYSVGSELFAATALPFIFWGLGWIWQQRGRRASAFRDLVASLEQERECHEQDAAAQERLRIGRELQDIIAQNVSAIIVQAGGARQLIGVDAGEAAARS